MIVVGALGAFRHAAAIFSWSGDHSGIVLLHAVKIAACSVAVR